MRHCGCLRTEACEQSHDVTMRALANRSLRHYTHKRYRAHANASSTCEHLRHYNHASACEHMRTRRQCENTKSRCGCGTLQLKHLAGHLFRTCECDGQLPIKQQMCATIQKMCGLLTIQSEEGPSDKLQSHEHPSSSSSSSRSWMSSSLAPSSEANRPQVAYAAVSHGT